MKNYCILSLVLFVVACASTPEEKFGGPWNATWNADPVSFGEMPPGTSYEMKGQFIFEEDSLEVITYGYPGCIFGVDTLAHKQKWKLQGDSLNLLSESGDVGMSYTILAQSETKVELKLLDDISVTLERD
jgi:hypothetical protein